ncbi:hypothetical protein BJY04DRAFT_215057 [Aspergillus karnatakaensis]|uniref:fungal specific transcription factor domain-containing protein n=1 Tax=Aspergillus karnatakaensis TaxID=1810916 RepID=UPI003CCD463C
MSIRPATQAAGQGKAERLTWSRRKTQVLLAAMLSLSYNFLPEGCQLSQRYFSFARQLLTNMVFSQTSVELVLAASILACQAYGCGNSNAAWIVNGISATAGNVLGFHVGADYEKWHSSGHISQSAMKIRVQSYWASVVIDRVLATCLGRHCLIHPTDFNMPLIQLKLPKSVRTTPEYGTLSYERNVVATFQHSVEFWKLSDQALYDFGYGLSKLSPDNANATAVFERVSEAVSKHRIQIQDWYTQLPQEIMLSRSHPVPHLILLEMAYHNCQILIHRPFILTCPCGSVNNRVEDPFLATISPICKEHALQIVELARVYQSHYSLQYSAFVLIHYLLNACKILAISCQPQIADKNDEPNTLSEALQTSIAALQEIAHTWSQAEKALHIVHHLTNNCDFRRRGCKSGEQPTGPNSKPISPFPSLDAVSGFGSSARFADWFNPDFDFGLLSFSDDFS